MDYVFSMHWVQTGRKEEGWGGWEAGRKKEQTDRKEGEQEGGKEGKKMEGIHALSED